VLADWVLHPAEIAGTGTLLVDGTVCPVWDWTAIPGLFSGKAGYPGMGIQIAATMTGNLAAVGPVPVPGSRHDAYAFEASGLKQMIAGMHAAADLGYTGVDAIAIVPFRTRPAAASTNPGQRSTPASARSAPQSNEPSRT
jgi:hypothetical protein